MVTTPSASQLRSRALKLLKRHSEKVGALEIAYKAITERHCLIAVKLLEVVPVNVAGVVLPAMISKTMDWQVNAYDEIRIVYQQALDPLLSELEASEKQLKREQRQLETLTGQVSRIESSIKETSEKIELKKRDLLHVETKITTLQQELVQREQAFLSFFKSHRKLREEIAVSNRENQQITDALNALKDRRVALKADLSNSERSGKISQLEEAVRFTGERCSKARDQSSDFELRTATFLVPPFDRQIETMENNFQSAFKELVSAVKEFPSLVSKKSEDQSIADWLLECEGQRCEAINLLSYKLKADSAPKDLTYQAKVVQSIMKVHTRHLEREEKKKQRSRIAREKRQVELDRQRRAIETRRRAAETRRQRVERQRRIPARRTNCGQSGEPDLNALREQFS